MHDLLSSPSPVVHSPYTRGDFDDIVGHRLTRHILEGGPHAAKEGIA